MRFHISTTRIDHESLYIGTQQSRTANQAHDHAVLTPVLMQVAQAYIHLSCITVVY